MNIQMLDPRSLVPYAKNVKIHDKNQVKKIAASIKKTGWDQPIVVDKDLEIIKGHGRTLAAIELGLDKVPVLVREELSKEEANAARIADNHVALGSIDTELLREELASIDFDMSGIFEDKELDFSLADLGSMNIDAFVLDVDAAVKEQENGAKEKAEEISTRRVPLFKVFGFKDIAGGNEIYLNRFMAYAEAKTGLGGEAALVQFAKDTMGD